MADDGRLPVIDVEVDEDVAFYHEPDPRPNWQRDWPRHAKRAALVAIPLALVAVLFTRSGGQDVSTPRLDTSVPGQTLRSIQTVAPPTTVVGASSNTTVVGIGEARSIDFVDTDPNTFWVSPAQGDDGNDGQTPDTPWGALQPALERLQAGQTLYLMSGEYTENREPGNAHYVLTADGRPDAWIRIAAGPGQEPVIVATQGNALSVRGDYVEVSGLDVVGRGFDTGNSYGWGIVVRGAHHVRVIGNTTSGMPVGGITAIESGNVEILYNEVFDNSFWGTEQGSGISIWHARDSGFPAEADGYHDVILGNTVYRNENKVFSRWKEGNVITDGNGIIVDQTDETGYSGRTLIANNTIFDNGGRGILVLESSRVDVVHNTTYQNGRTEILLGGPVELAAGQAEDVRFFNNLAWSRPGAHAIRVNTASNVEMGGNVFVTDQSPAQSTDLDLVTTTNPGLIAPGIDPLTVDFRPTTASVLIGRGIAVSPQVLIDADNQSRPGGGSTVGAFEVSD